MDIDWLVELTSGWTINHQDVGHWLLFVGALGCCFRWVMVDSVSAFTLMSCPFTGGLPSWIALMSFDVGFPIFSSSLVVGVTGVPCLSSVPRSKGMQTPCTATHGCFPPQCGWQYSSLMDYWLEDLPHKGGSSLHFWQSCLNWLNPPDPTRFQIDQERTDSLTPYLWSREVHKWSPWHMVPDLW